jgi:hypothetical protein
MCDGDRILLVPLDGSSIQALIAVVIEKLSVTFSYYAPVATKRFLVATMFLSSPPPPIFPLICFPL